MARLALYGTLVGCAAGRSPYFKVDQDGYIMSSRWRSRLIPGTDQAAITLAQATGPSVDIPGLGNVVGGTTGDVDYFLGMPYAQTPTGTLRFMPAQAVTAWDGALTAQNFCPSPLQSVDQRKSRLWTLRNDSRVREDEDSLCINVWRPSGDQGKTGMPIMVFIYGGGFTSGSSSNAQYDGKNLAGKGRVIVSFNYRVGPLGFFSSPELITKTGATGGANGLRDQNLALKFVQKYGAAFGGDVNNVGLFGESAGSLSVCSHLVSPTSAGLFKRAILESGPCNGPWGPGNKAEGLAMSANWMKAQGCSDISCLQALPANDLASWPYSYEQEDTYESSWKLTNFMYEFPGYWVDDYFLPAQPYQLFANASINPESVMIVANSMDGFTPFLYPWNANFPDTCSDSTQMQTHWDPWGKHSGLGAEVTTQYPCSTEKVSGVANASWQYAIADRDYNLHCASNYLANQLLARGKGAYRAMFSVGPRQSDAACYSGMVPCCGGSSGRACYGWASHGAELGFVFGTFENACQAGDPCQHFSDPFTDTQAALSNSMMNYWTSFLATGTPVDESGGVAWPPANQGIVNLDTPKVTVSSDAATSECQFWGQYYPDEVRSASAPTAMLV